MTLLPVTNQGLSATTPVLVTRQSEAVWMAQLLIWAEFAVEGNSREDALLKLERQVQARLITGEIAYLELPLDRSDNPWLAIAGKYADDPNWDDYMAEIAADRQAATAAELDQPGDSIA